MEYTVNELCNRYVVEDLNKADDAVNASRHAVLEIEQEFKEAQDTLRRADREILDTMPSDDTVAQAHACIERARMAVRSFYTNVERYNDIVKLTHQKKFLYLEPGVNPR